MIPTFHKLIFIKICLLLLVNQTFAQQTFFQGFEQTAGDSWIFTATPNPYNVTAGDADDFWTDTTAVDQISPATGNRFWFMLDLENPNGGGSFFHTLDFATIDVSAFSTNTLTFKYYTIGYEAADSIGYILETDNGTTWNLANYVDLDRNTLAWTTVNIPVPAGAQFVRLRLIADQNGATDYAGFDDIRLISSNGDITPPEVLNAKTLNANTIRLVFSEGMDATAENTANYTGIADLSSAVRNTAGDTVILTFGTPFVNGAANTLTVSNVQDEVGNALDAPFLFNFIWNSSTPNLVITEINYNPPSSDPDTLEFIEIYNNDTLAAPVGGLQFGGIVSLELPIVTLTPGGIILIAQNKAACEGFFPGQTFYQWTGGQVLTNGGNTLFIRNSEGVKIDSVQYDDASPWPTEPDGNGPSAELLSPNLDNNDGANWKASTTATSDPGIFASPGVVTVDSLPIIGFATTSTLVQENDESITIQVNVNNMNLPYAEAKVRVISASTAVAGEDYVLFDTLVSFTQFETDPALPAIILINDPGLRNSRYLILQLSDFVASAAGTITEHVLLINDDDTKAPQPQANSPVSLQYLSSFFVDSLPASAEISTYDPESKHIFTTNILQNRLEIIDFKNPVALSKIVSIDISAYGGGINSVAFSDGAVAVAVEDTVITNPGKIVFFDVNGNFLSAVSVGALPDQLSFTKDGSKLLVANEGEPAPDYSADPEGSVSVIDMTPGAAALTQANVTNIGFTQFEADIDALRAAGVRIFGPSNSVSQNVEPEYITVSDDGKTAWVTLQEANALAIIDLDNNVVTAIEPLGFKDWNNFGSDVSDQSPGVFFNNWNIKGMYQPDAIAHWTSGGQEYLITANEGDLRDWAGYTEISRVSASAYKLDSTVFPDAAYLKRSELLGRLNVSTATGDTDGDGDFDEIHTFGGRSIAIWNATTKTLVWDSGDDLERITAADPVYGSMFNASNTGNALKNRSDDKGPEPEGIALGTIEGRNYAFTALERIGGVMVYDITNPAAPEFVQWINTRLTGSTAGGDLGPEGIIFIPKAQSPNARDLVVVSNEISGSLSVFQINIDKTQTGEYGLTTYAFDNLPPIGVYGDTIREGGISGLMYRDGSFRFVSDRGPNADATNSPLATGATTLLFPFPDYAPKTWQVRPENGALTIEDFDFIKRPDGTGASGLPLPVGQGNTGEVAWADTLATVLDNDEWGLDSEGLTQDNEGNFWVCEEYGTSIWKLDAQFKVLQRYTPFPVETEDLPLDSLLGKRRANRGFEGIAYTPNGKIFAIIQSPMDNPNTATGNTSRIHRLVELDPATGAMRTFVYVHEPELGQIRSRDWKIGDLTAINNEEFLVVEHAERNGWNSKNMYTFSIANATPVTGNDFGGSTLEQLTANDLTANGIIPVQKEFFADLLELGWDRSHDKPEGLTILNDSTFAVINDNDFGISAPNLDGKIVLTGKTTQLYVYTLPADKHLDYVNPYCKVVLGNDLAGCANEGVPIIAGGDDFAQYAWSTGDTTKSITVNTSGAVLLEATNAFGCRSRDTIDVLLNPNPTVDLGTDPGLCDGHSQTLDAGNPGATYHWSNNAQTQTIKILTPGNYTVTVTDNNGCSNADTVAVTLLPSSASTLTASACEGGFYTYNGVQIPAGGTQQFILTNVFGCDSTITVAVVANPLPVVDLGPDSTICEGQTLTIDAGNATSYNWSNGAMTQTITVGTSDLYAVTVTNSFGCQASSDIAVSVIVCIGTEEQLALQNVSVFPNPTSGALTVQFAELPAKTTNLSVLNTVGQVVAQEQVRALSTSLDLSGLPKGLYFLRLQSGTRIQTVRVVVQ